MAWHFGTSPSSNSYREILTRLVAFATSKYVSAAAVNAGGTGYTVGDLLTITHAGAYGNCVLEVLTAPAGVIGSVAIRSAGAFGNRVASVAVNAGGSGYTNGTVVRLTTGTATQQAKLLITVSAGAVTSAAVFETGGHYTSNPSSSGATNSDIGTGSGTGFTCTPTMTGLIGTSAIAVTGGTGTGATFNLTLTDGGWTCLVDRNDFSFNSVTDEKELILQGTVAGGLPPLVGIRTYTTLLGDLRYGWLVAGMDSFNSALTFASQPNIGPSADPSTNSGCCFLLFDNAQSYWFKVSPRYLNVHVKAVGASITSYVSQFAGLLDPHGTQVESPYPMYLSGSSSSYQRKPDAGGQFVTGFTELIHDGASLCPAFFRHPSTGVWTRVQNLNATTSLATRTHVVSPLGCQQFAGGTVDDDIVAFGRFGLSFASGTGFALTNLGASTQVYMPTISDGNLELWPVSVLSSPTTGANTSEIVPRGNLPGVFWHGATKADGSAVVVEDTVTISGVRHRIFANAHRRERCSFYAVAEN